MSTYKISKELKKRMERELRQYDENKKQLNNLKKNNSASTRKYLYIEQRLIYVENVYEKLKPFEKEVYDLIFKQNYNPIYVETNKNISKSTYYNVLIKVYIFLLKSGEKFNKNRDTFYCNSLFLCLLSWKKS